MRAAWAAGLTAVRAPKAPLLDGPLRVVTQRKVPSDGVSEAGLSGASVARLFERFADVELVQVERLDAVDWAALPKSGRATVLVSNHRDRYSAASRAWTPDLHLVLWNPFQTLDIDAPAVVTWGYADGALDALRAWLEGRGPLPGRAPVRLAG
jgi:beta-N-acetylhexosaminidase